MSFAQFGKRKATRWSSSSPSNETDALQRQIDNAAMRIQDAGYQVENTDKRNWFEKATNLPQGQNFIFDTLEILGRPGNAIKNVIDKSLTDKSQSIGFAAYRGLAGKDKVSGSDLAEKGGIENKAAKFALGTALDIALDPITYVPGGAIAKGIKGGASLAATPLKAGYKALETASPGFKSFVQTQVAPRAEAVKDGLGYAFKPGYKDTETLYGTQSGFLKDLKRETENTRRFMQEDALGGIVKTAKETGLEAGTDVGRLMEAPLKQLDEAGNILQRPARELSTDPKIQQAAKTLTESNDMIRQYAKDNGIDITEIEGYMTHVWSKAERESRQRTKRFMVDQGRFGTGNPNKKILNPRELMGSAEDVNEQIGRQFFEPNAYFATAIGQKRLIDYIQAATFRKQILSNSDFAQKYTKGMDIPSNAAVINTNKYTFLKEGGDLLDGVVKETVGGEYIVTKAVKQALDRFQHINSDEGMKAFMKALSGAQNTWKKLALFSPGYHVRNFMGNLWNSYAIGMNPYQLAKYSGEAVDELRKALSGKESQIFKEFRQEGLLASGLTKVEMGPDVEGSIEKAVRQMSKTGGAKALDKVKNPFQTSRELGENADAVNRFALYKWARDKGMDSKQAAEKVREALFDYMDLTEFERKVMKNLMPFYTWSRKNIPYQIQRFINDPQRFQKLNYVRQNAQEAVGLNEETLPDYMKENFYMPLFGKDGKGKMLSLNLPVGDIPKLSDPLKLGTDLLSPLIKTPIELASNYNTFKRKPIERFEGQTKQLQIPGTDQTIDIPIKLAYALEQATGQVGRGVSTFLQKPENVDQENMFMNPSLGIGSFVKDFDAEKYDYYAQMDYLRKLQDLILWIEQQEGAKPRTVAEIKRGR